MATENIKIKVDATNALSNLRELDNLIKKTTKSFDKLNKVSLDKLSSKLSKLESDLNKLSNANLKGLSSSFDNVGDAILTPQEFAEELNKLIDELDRQALEGIEGEFQELTDGTEESILTVKELQDSLEQLNRMGTTESVEGEMSEVGTEATETKRKIDMVTDAIIRMNKTSTRGGRDMFNNFNNHLLATQSLLSEVSSFATSSVTDAIDLDNKVREMTFQFSAVEGKGKSIGYDEMLASESEYWERLQRSAEITSFSVEDVVDAGTELAKSGIDISTSTDMIEQSMYNAQMTGYGLEKTLHAVTGVANVFGEDLKNAPNAGERYTKYLDGITMAADATASDVSDVIQGMNYMGPVASTANVSFEESVALIGSLGDVGLEASKGARVLASGLQRLFAPTDDAQVMLDKYNIQLYDSENNTRDLLPVIEDLQKAMKGMTDEDTATFMNSVFGKSSTKAWGAVLNSSITELADIQNQITESTGYSTEKAFAVLGGMTKAEIKDFKKELDGANTELERTKIIQDKLMETNPLLYLDGWVEGLQNFKTVVGSKLGINFVRILDRIDEGLGDIQKSLLNNGNSVAEALGLDKFESFSDMMAEVIADVIILIGVLGGIGLSAWYIKLIGPLGIIAGIIGSTLLLTDDLSGKLQDLGNTITNGLILPLIEWFKQNEETIANIVNNLWTIFSNVIEGFAGINVGGLGSGLLGVLEGITEVLVTLTSTDVGKSMSGAFAWIYLIDKFTPGKFVTKILVIKKSFELLGKAMETVGVMWAKKFGVKTLLPTAGKGFGKSLGKVFGGQFLSGFTGALATLGGGSATIGGGIVAGLGVTLASSLEGAIIEVKRNLESQNLEGVGVTLGDKILGGIKAVFQEGSLQASVTNTFIGLFSLTEKFFGVGGGIVTLLQQTKDKVREINTLMWTDFKTKMSEAVTAGKQSWEDLKNSILTLPDTVSNALSGMYDKILGWVPKILEALNPLSNISFPSVSGVVGRLPGVSGATGLTTSITRTYNNTVNNNYSISRGGKQFAVGVDM